MLIYLGSVQKNIIPLFHYALKPAGFLMLGASETAALRRTVFGSGPRAPDLCQAGSREKAASRFTRARARPSRRGAPAGQQTATEPAAEVWDGVDVRKEVDRILLSKYSPAGVVVDEDLDVSEIRGKASPFLTLPAGKVSFNLLKLIPDTGLFLEVEKLIQQARQQRRAGAAGAHTVTNTTGTPAK